MISSLELARLCGVSQGTVDRALHNRPGVSPATKARILDTAKKHGYIPHPAMQEIISGRSDLVGAVVPSMNSPFFMDLMQSAAEACLCAGVRLLITPVSDREEFLRALTEFTARRFRGALVVPPEENIEVPREISLPIASLLSSCSAYNTRMFGLDEEETGRAATRYLHELGHSRIMHVTYPRKTSGIQGRANGYEKAMSEVGYQPCVYVDTDPALFAAAIEQYKPTAIFCHNDWLAMEVIRRLGSAGIRVPDDISVLGVDNSPTFSALYSGISTMRYPIAEIAGDAVMWLFDNARSVISRNVSIVPGDTVRRNV